MTKLYVLAKMTNMETVTAAEAKANLSELLRRAEAGTETIVTRHGQPVAKLVPIRPRIAGGMKDQITVLDDDWWASDPDIAAQFGTSG